MVNPPFSDIPLSIPKKREGGMRMRMRMMMMMVMMMMMNHGENDA
jgi:hypothetical protein